MSKRPLFNRQRVFYSARPRRLVSTFVPVLLGLSSLRVLPIPPVVPILPDVPPLFAQSSPSPNERSQGGAAPNEQNQAVFFSIPVGVDGAIVRSGPSEDAYPTGTLAKNRYVEAYFRDADGWCAIRPPQGSFSWINAKFVRRESDSTGRVVASNGKAAPARVGGATVEESAIVQVGLKNGRQIKILGETRLSDGSTWLKIAPPPGEFRWLRASDLLDDPAIAQLPSKLTFQREFLEQLARASAERSVAPSASKANLSALENAARAGRLAQNTQNGRFGQNDASLADVVPEMLPASVVAAGAPGSTQTASTPPNAQNAPIAPNPRDSQNLPTSQNAQNIPTALTASSTQTAPSDASEEFATQFKKEIARLNADVFQTLRQNPPSDAELAVLATRAEYLFDAAPTDGERFVVQSIYDAIKIAERRNRSRSNAAASTPRDLPISPNAPVFPAPTGVSPSPLPDQTSRFPLSAPRNGLDAAGRFGEFDGEGDLPTLVLPDSNFDASVPAGSVAPSLGAANGFAPAYFPQTSDFNAQNGLSSPWNAPNLPRLSNDVQFSVQNQPNATVSEKRPRLAFAFSDANNPFRSRAKNKEVRVAPFAPQSGERSSGLSKLPPLLPTQKQFIVPPPNYRSGPFGQNDRAKEKSDSLSTVVASSSRPTSATVRPAPSSQTAQITSTSKTAQELTVDSVRWRAVEPNAPATSSSSAPDVSSETSSVAASSASAPSNAGTSVVSAIKFANTDKGDKIGKVSPIGANVSAKPPVLTGASVPQTNKKSKNANKNVDKNAFQPISSRNVASFDAYGVLAKLPKAPKGTPRYALTRPVGDRFEIVSYLEAERNVSLERYVGRKIGVKGTRGTIQIGENTQKLTTVQTVFAQE